MANAPTGPPMAPPKGGVLGFPRISKDFIARLSAKFRLGLDHGLDFDFDLDLIFDLDLVGF